MIQPKTIGPNNDWCVLCGGCVVCEIASYVIFGAAVYLG